MSRLSLFRYVSVIDKLNAFGAQILDLTAYPLLVSPSNSEEVAKAIAEQRKEALIVLLAFFAIQINLEDKAGAFVTFTLISLALTLRIYLENIPVETTLGRINAMGPRKFSVINAIPVWGTLLVTVWMIISFIPSPFVIAYIAVAASAPIIWRKVASMNFSDGNSVA